MKLEYIIEGLNRHIEQERINKKIQTKGHLVLQKVININSTFKVFRTYNIIVWFVKNNKRYKILELSHTDKVVDNNEDTAYKNIIIKLSNALFNFIGSEAYNKIIMGEYNGES